MIVWSLATGAGGLAAGFVMLLLTRCFVGVGEGAYGPLAPTILSDCFPVAKRGKILSLFYVAMPVGGALGYALGGFVAKLDPAQRRAGVGRSLSSSIPGLILGDPVALDARVARRCGGRGLHAQADDWRDYRILLQTPSFVLDTLGMTAMSFAMGALAWWMPDYLETHHVPDLVRRRAADRIRHHRCPGRAGRDRGRRPCG